MAYKDKTCPETKRRISEIGKRWRKNHPEKYKRVQRNANLQRCFGITLSDYEGMHDRQKGLCAICQKPEKHLARKGGRTLNLAVDHDHATNKIRELLCMDCNKGIGCFGEDILRMQAAIEYIRKHSTGEN